jgi:rubrerythrin
MDNEDKAILEDMDSIIQESAGKNAKSDRIAMEILELAIKLEKLTKSHYVRIAGKVVNPLGKSVFEYLAEETGNELKALETQRSALEKDKKWLAKEDVKPLRSVCPVVLPNEAKSGILPKTSDVQSDESDLDALKLAIDVKKRLVLFYCKAGSKLKDSYGKRMFAELVEASERHLNELEVQFAWLDRTGFWYDPGMMTD